MSKIISKPICWVCGKRFDKESFVYESKNEICYCSVECILKAKGFRKIRWCYKYTEVENRRIVDEF